MQRRIKAVLTSLLTTGFVLPVAAEDVPVLRQNQFEVGLFTGFNYGADHSHVMGGGNITYSALRWLLPYAEVSYLPSIQRTVIDLLTASRMRRTCMIFRSRPRTLACTFGCS